MSPGIVAGIARAPASQPEVEKDSALSAVLHHDTLLTVLYSSAVQIVESLADPVAIEQASLSHRASALNALSHLIALAESRSADRPPHPVRAPVPVKSAAPARAGSSHRPRIAQPVAAQAAASAGDADADLPGASPLAVDQFAGQSPVPLSQHTQIDWAQLPVLDHNPAVNHAQVGPMRRPKQKTAKRISKRAAHRQRVRSKSH